MQRSRLLHVRLPGWICLFLLVALFSQAAPGALAASTRVISVETPALTATGVFNYSAAAEHADNPEDLLLVGLATSADGEADVLAVTWTRTVRGWLPVWSLQLVEGAASSESGTADRTLELARIAPTPGGVYRWAISYDQASGSFAVVVTDAHSGERLVKQGAALTSYDGPLHLLANGAVETFEPNYIPLDSSMQVGILRSSGTFLPISRVEPHETPWLQLHTSGKSATGTYRFRVEDEGGTVLTERTVEPEEQLIALAEALPIGRSRIVAEYVDRGEVLWSESQWMQVGAVAADFSRTERLGPTGPIAAAVTLRSESPLPPVQVEVEARLSRLEWDPEARAYVARPHGEPFIVYSGEVRLAPDAPVTVPLQFAAPATPGTYRVHFEPRFSPSVAGHITNTQTHFASYPPFHVRTGESFTIAIFPDTQIYAMHYPGIFFRQAEWLAAQAEELNLAFVLHVGDITNDNTPMQWRVAAEALKLLTHRVPYVLSLGNHDYVPLDRPGGGQVYSRDDSLIHEYFGEADFPLLAGAMVQGRLDNTYHLFDVGEEKYLVVSLEFAPSDEAIAWADDVIATYPDHTAIVLTHKYLRADGSPVPSGTTASYYELAKDPTTSINDGTDLWRKLLRRHANIEWVISGHRLTSAIPYRVTRGEHGNPVYQLLANFQGEGEGGDGYLILLTMHPDGTVEARSYSPYYGTYKTDVDQYGFTNHIRIDRNLGQAWVIRPVR